MRKLRDVEGVLIVIEACPHCGQYDSSVNPWFDELSDKWNIICDGCGSSSGSYRSALEAVRAWNKRAPIADQITSRVYNPNPDQPVAIFFADGTNIRIQRDGMGAWLEIAQAEVVKIPEQAESRIPDKNNNQ